MKNKKYDAAKVERASRREAHFSNGGTTATWRGRAVTFTDRKKKDSRMSCRRSQEIR